MNIFPAPFREYSTLAKRAWDVLFILSMLSFASWLMFHTFNYNFKDQVIEICGKIYSDFGATLPIIRSFSFGDNWPPEYPIYPGQPIQYHYLFYYLVGQLERLGLQIHWALNLPSIAGFFGIMAMIYALAKRLFNDRRVATLSVLFFIFNGSLAFWYYYAHKHALTWAAPKEIFQLRDYIDFGPWDGGPVLAFWHLNVFINQRHFCFALGILLVFTYICLILRNRRRETHILIAIVFGLVFGLFPILHKPMMLVLAAVMGIFFLALPYLRLFLILTGAVTVAEIGLLTLLKFNPLGAPGGFGWFPGGFAHSVPNVEYIKFFWYQFGLHNLLIPLGFIIAPRRAKIFMLPAIAVLAVAFMFRFANDVMLNHKFVNYALIMLQMLSAYALMRGYDYAKATLSHAPALLKFTGVNLATGVTGSMLLALTLSGIIDLFPIINECGGGVQDVGSNPIAKWYYENTPRNAVILNTRLMYDPASIAGRKVFLGWPYFTASSGYDVKGRFDTAKEMYEGGDPNRFCPLFKHHNISYVAVEDTSRDAHMVKVNFQYFVDNFTPAYTSADGKFWIFSTKALCEK